MRGTFSARGGLNGKSRWLDSGDAGWIAEVGDAGAGACDGSVDGRLDAGDNACRDGSSDSRSRYGEQKRKRALDVGWQRSVPVG